MEFLLLWADDLDDALGALRHLAPRLLGLLLALGLFAATGFALLWAPQLTLAALALVLSATLFETVRRRRAPGRQPRRQTQRLSRSRAARPGGA